MNILKKIKKYRPSPSKFIITGFSFILIVFIWGLLFNPIMHSFISTDEAYMEDVIGMYESDAVDTLKQRGFEVKISYLNYQEGIIPYTVFDMFPKPFTKVKKNRIVELSVFKDKATIVVPNYTGLDLKEVQKRIKKDKLKLYPKDIMFFPENNISKDKVYFQSPEAGSKVLEGGSLKINVSLGKSDGAFEVPMNIIGSSIDNAILQLRKSMFSIGDIDTIYNEDFLEETVFEIYYNGDSNQKIEIYEGMIFTVPIRVNIVITKDEE